MREVVPFVLAATLGLGGGWGMYSYLDNKDSNRPIVKVHETGEHSLSKIMAQAHNFGMDMEKAYLENKAGSTPSTLNLEQSAENLASTLEKYQKEVLSSNQSLPTISQGGNELLQGYDYDRYDHEEYVSDTCTDSEGNDYECGSWEYDYSIHKYTFDKNTVLAGINHIRQGKKGLTSIESVPLREIAEQTQNIESSLEEKESILENYRSSSILPNHSALRKQVEKQQKATGHERVFSEIDTFRDERYRRSSRYVYKDRIPPGFDLTQQVGTEAAKADDAYRTLSRRVNSLQQLTSQISNRQFTPKALGDKSLEVYQAIGEKTSGRMSTGGRWAATIGTAIGLGLLGGFGRYALSENLPRRNSNYVRNRRRREQAYRQARKRKNDERLRENVRKQQAQEARRREQERKRQEKASQPVPKPDVKGRRTLKDLLDGLRKPKD